MKVRMEKGVAVVALKGWLMGGAETDEMEKTIREALERGNRCLVLDLGDVNHMNSTALGKLVGLRTSYVNRGGTIKLCNLDKKIENLFVITKLSLVFDVHASEREALASFGPGGCPEPGT
jgi:anti-sigma B factor antagonist